jgi:hypothetical protein
MGGFWSFTKSKSNQNLIRFYNKLIPSYSSYRYYSSSSSSNTLNNKFYTKYNLKIKFRNINKNFTLINKDFILIYKDFILIYNTTNSITFYKGNFLILYKVILNK